MKKRIIGIMLVVVMFVGVLPFAVFADSHTHIYDHDYDKKCNYLGCDYERQIKMQSVLLMGQSNMSGRGDLSTVASISDDRIFMMCDNAWVKMEEPLHDDGGRGRAGLGASFAKAFVESFDCEIGLIPCAVGGTSLADWTVGGELYSNAVSQAKVALESSEICAILWHQGESDQKNENYATQLKVIFDAMIEELGLDADKLVIITGELFGTRGDACHTAQLELLENEYENYGVAYSDGLTVFDVTTHFDAPSLRVFGYRYFDVFYNCITGEHYTFDQNPESYRIEHSEKEFGDPIISENWNDDAIGDAVSVSNKVSYTLNGGNIIVAALSGNEKYLSMTTGIKSGSNYGDTFVDFYKTIEAGAVIVLEAKFKLVGENNAYIDLFKPLNSDNNSFRTIRIHPNGRIYNMVDGELGDSLGYSLDELEWTKIRIVLDLKNNVKNIYILNQLVLISEIDSNWNADNVLKRFRAVQFISTTKGASSLMVDDFACYYGTPADVVTNITYIANERFGDLTADTVYTSKTTVNNISFDNLSDKSYIKVVSENNGDNYLAITRGDSKGTWFGINSKIAANTNVVIQTTLKLGEGNPSGDLLKLVAEIDSNNKPTYNLLYLDSKGRICDYVYTNGSGAQGEALYTLSTDVWTSVKVVCDLRYNTKDIYINGTLVRSSLPIHSSSTYGAKVNSCRVIYMRGGTGTLCVDDVSYYALERTTQVSGYTLSLEGDIGVNAYAIFNDKLDTDKIFAKFTVDGVTTEQKLGEHTEYGYKFTCKINATQMTSEIKFELYEGESSLITDTYSVAEYAKAILTNDEYADAQKVVKAMLNYGSLSQEYFEIEAEDPAKDYKYTTELEAVTRDVIAEKSVNKKSGSVEGLTYTGSWVELRSTLVLYHSFTVSGDIADYTFSFGDKTLEPIWLGENSYAIAVTEVYAQDMATEYAVTVNGTYTLTYNALNYLKLAYSDASLKNLVSSLYLYYAEAYDYFN